MPLSIRPLARAQVAAIDDGMDQYGLLVVHDEFRQAA
jgi:hypothetical protein